MARVAEQFVGRAAQLGEMERAVAELEGKQPAALLLVGEPGIGKSRLLAELGTRADTSGCIVLSGSASELERDLPFSLFVDALDEYVAGLDRRRLESLDGDVRGELARVLPSLADFGANGGCPSRTSATARTARYGSCSSGSRQQSRWCWCSTMCTGPTQRRPSCWAPCCAGRQARLCCSPWLLGRSSCRTAWRRRSSVRIAPARSRASSSAGSSENRPACCWGRTSTARWSTASTRRAAATRSISSNSRGRHSEPAAAPCVTQTWPWESRCLPRWRRRWPRSSLCCRRRLARSWRARPYPATRSSRSWLPPRRPLTSRRRRTPSTSCCGSSWSGRRRCRAVFASAIRWCAGPSTRAPPVAGCWERMRCAETLAERGASAAAQAHHVEHAARQGDKAALTVLREAGEAATFRAPASAARWFGASLRLLPENVSPNERVELLLARAQALGATGRLEESRADLLESLALVPEEQVAVGVKLTVACAGVEHMLGHYAEARARITAALDRIPDAAAPEEVTLMIVLAFDGLFRADFEAMGGAAERALEVARPLADLSLTATAAAVLTLARAWGGAIEAAETTRAEAVALVEAMSDEQLAGRIDAAAHLAAAELYMDRYEDARAHAERALSVARATGQHFPTLIPTLATAHFMLGRLAEATEAIDGGIESARLTNIPFDLAWRLHLRSSVALAAGEIDTALRTAEEAVELTRELDENFVSAYPGLGLAAALASAGQPARAIDVLVGSAGGEELVLIPRGWRAYALELLARCHLELGRHERAARAAFLAEAAASGVGLPIAEAWAGRAAAAVALEAGDPAEAAKRALASAELAERAGVVVEAALARTLAGRALAQAGQSDAAATELERAAEALEGCGALRHRDAAERELRKLGRHIHRPTRRGTAGAVGVESLTERELEVAWLVVGRQTNREIAAELFVSLKTVETHMRNLFRKLDVSSRVEVARVVERSGRSAS